MQAYGFLGEEKRIFFIRFGSGVQAAHDAIILVSLLFYLPCRAPTPERLSSAQRPARPGGGVGVNHEAGGSQPQFSLHGSSGRLVRLWAAVRHLKLQNEELSWAFLLRPCERQGRVTGKVSTAVGTSGNLRWARLGLVPHLNRASRVPRRLFIKRKP